MKGKQAMKQLKQVKKGEFFTRKPYETPTEKQVFIKRNYDRATKKYDCQRFSDISDYIQLKPETIVYTDFTF